jgi:hypothetical protein
MGAVCLEQLERARAGGRREGTIELGKVLGRQLDVERRPVIPHMLEGRRLGDHHHVRLPQHPGKRDLCGGGAMANGGAGENAVAQEPALLDRRIGLDRHAPLPAPG